MKKFEGSTVHSPRSTVGNRRSSVVGRLWTLLLIAATLSCAPKKQAAQEKYTCPMHPQIIQDKPGKCPICFMDLVKVGTPMDDGSIMLSENQIKLANITIAPAVKKEFEIKTILNGKIAVNEERTEIISSRVQGRIEKLFLKEVGLPVLQGQPLYEIYSEQLLTLQQEFLLAQRQAEELKEKRFQSFLKASEKKLLLFGMTRDQITALSKQERANSRITFLAPASGVIDRIDVNEGQYASEGGSLFRIELLDKVWVEADIYSNETRLVKVGDDVKVQVNGFENKLVNGKIIFVSPEFREGNQIITVRVQIENPERKFIPGMQANVILSHSGRRAIVIPIDAIVKDDTGSSAWIKTEEGGFRMRMVTTGEETSEEIEITDGLEENENVVISGAYLLQSEMILKKGASQHQHM